MQGLCFHLQKWKKEVGNVCVSKCEYVQDIQITDHTETHILPHFRTLNSCHIGLLDYVVVEVN